MQPTLKSVTDNQSSEPERASERLARLHTGSWLDPWVRRGLTLIAALIFILLIYFLVTLVDQSRPVFAVYSPVDFITEQAWIPSQGNFGALALVVGTLLTSAIALILGVPIAVATAIYITQLAPHRLRGPLTGLIELLAAVPSVVYGLWGITFLAPMLLPLERWVNDTFAFLPLIGQDDPIALPNYFILGLVLAIMILPIVSAVSREVMSTVPSDHKEAALALGATRWEMIRTAVLPYSLAGITGGAMLGLGRALGETIAAAILVGNATGAVGDSLFAQGATLAGVIAAQFNEASADPTHRAALVACGLLLFALTLVINAIARGFIARSESRLTRAEARAKRFNRSQMIVKESSV